MIRSSMKTFVFAILNLAAAANMAKADSLSIATQLAFKQCEKAGQKVTVDQARVLIGKSRSGSCGMSVTQYGDANFELGPWTKNTFSSEQKVLAGSSIYDSACILREGDRTIVTMSAPLDPPTPPQKSRAEKISDIILGEEYQPPQETYDSKRTMVVISYGSVRSFVQLLTPPQMKWETTENAYDYWWNDQNPIFFCSTNGAGL